MADIHKGVWKDMVVSNMEILGLSHYHNDKKKYVSEFTLAVETVKIILIEYGKIKKLGKENGETSLTDILLSIGLRRKEYGILKATFDLYDFYIEGEVDEASIENVIEVTESMIYLAFDAIDYAVRLYNRTCSGAAQWITSKKMKEFIKATE